jgi:hypothetical protein
MKAAIVGVAHWEEVDGYASVGVADPVRFATALSSPDSCAAFVHDALEPVDV